MMWSSLASLYVCNVYAIILCSALQEALSDSARHCALLHAPALAALQAPSGSSPDVSSRLLDICNVADACEGLSIEAVIAAAKRELKPSGSPGEHRLSGLECTIEEVSADHQWVVWMHHVIGFSVG